MASRSWTSFLHEEDCKVVETAGACRVLERLAVRDARISSERHFGSAGGHLWARNNAIGLYLWLRNNAITASICRFETLGVCTIFTYT